MILPTPSSRVDNDLAPRFWASTWLLAHVLFPELQIHMDMGLLGRIAGMPPPLLSLSPFFPLPWPSSRGPSPSASALGLGPDLLCTHNHAAHQGRMTRPCPQHPPPPPPPNAVRLKVVSLPMPPCLGTYRSWRRPSTFLGPSGPGSPQRSVTGQGPDGVCLCPRSIGVDTHRSGCHAAPAAAAIAANIILPPPPPAAAGPFFLFILSHQGHTCGYLEPSRRCRVCVPFFLFSSRSLTPSLFHLTN